MEDSVIACVIAWAYGGAEEMPFPDPGYDAEPAVAMELSKAMERFAGLFWQQYKKWADDRIRRLGLNTAIFSGDDAVSDALGRLWKALERNGRPRQLYTMDDVKREFERHMSDGIREEWRRQRTMRRGGRLVFVPLPTSDNDYWHPADEPTHAPVDRREGRQAVETLLALLDREAPPLARILRLRLSNESYAKIASELDLSVATIKRRMRRIRSFCSRHLDLIG